MHTKLIAATLLICSLSSPAAHWPSWRGPHQDNTSSETRFPTQWSRSENVKWRAPLPEAGNSSPIVWGDTVFVTQAVRDGKERTLMAFDRVSGKLRWQQGVAYEPEDPRHKTNPHCSNNDPPSYRLSEILINYSVLPKINFRSSDALIMELNSNNALRSNLLS